MKTENLTIYFDGACHLCSKEIATYRKKDSQNLINYVDISEPNFDAEKEGLEERNVNKYFHVKDAEGKIHSGVEAFYQIWKELNIFSTLQDLARNPVTRKLMDIGYYTFAQIRPYLPKKKDCHTGNCKI